MVENENYKSYTANNGTELRFPKESVVQMTAEQRDCYQNFINVLAQILIIATSKIAVTLDNCSKKWYNMSHGDEKNGQNAAQ